ncbi:alternative oxidase [Chytriomyces sp. MP71]|nr:alternative oxidase [Chytriomyces sp. MP71]
MQNALQVQHAQDALHSKDYVLFHPVYTKEEIEATKFTHRSVTGIKDSIAYALVRLMRFGFDTGTGYTDKVGIMTEQQWLNRIVFLETVAGVPGFVAGMVRHMRSLRLLRRDHGWIHTLLEEAENERMHLLTFMKLKNPGPFFRMAVLLTQGMFFNAYFLCYLLSPQTCHRFVGYLEESAVHTYTLCLKDIEHGRIKHWGTSPAPDIAKFYWQLGENATVKDVVAAVRADEADHRDTNHVLANLQRDDPNPFVK